MRHFFLLGTVAGLPGRVVQPARAALLIAAARGLEGPVPHLGRAGAGAVPLPAVTAAAQVKEPATVGSGADDQSQRIHTLPRSGRGGWTATGDYAKKGAATRALPGVMPPEGPG
jgi:hypothetical protein